MTLRAIGTVPLPPHRTEPLESLRLTVTRT